MKKHPRLDYIDKRIMQIQSKLYHTDLHPTVRNLLIDQWERLQKRKDEIIIRRSQFKSMMRK